MVFAFNTVEMKSIKVVFFVIQMRNEIIVEELSR